MKFQAWVPESWRNQCRKLHEFSIQHAPEGDHTTLLRENLDLYCWLWKYSDLIDVEMSFAEWNRIHFDDFHEELNCEQTNALADHLDTALKETPRLQHWDKLPPPENIKASHNNPGAGASQEPEFFPNQPPSKYSSITEAEPDNPSAPPLGNSGKCLKEKKQPSLTKLYPNDEDDNTVEALQGIIQRLKHENDDLHCKMDDLADKVEDAYGGRGRLASSLIKAACGCSSSPGRQGKKRRSTEDDTNTALMKTLSVYEKRLQEQEDQVSRCRYLVSAAKAFSEERATLEETINILSNPGVNLPQTQDIGIQVTAKDSPISTHQPRTKQACVSRGTQTEKSCFPD